LPGLEEFTREKLQLSARVGKLQNISGLVDTVEDPSFTVVVGLMLLDMLLLPSAPMAHGTGNDSARGLLNSLFGWLHR